MLKEKNLGQYSKNCFSFYPKKFQYALKYMGLGSGIRKKPIPYPGSWGQKGTGSRIRNTAFHFGGPTTCILLPGLRIQYNIFRSGSGSSNSESFDPDPGGIPGSGPGSVFEHEPWSSNSSNYPYPQPWLFQYLAKISSFWQWLLRCKQNYFSVFVAYFLL